MKVSVHSDLHFEFGEGFITNTNNAKVLLLAGDILVANDNITKQYYGSLVKEMVKQYDYVLAIPGNHEYYDGDIDEVNAYLDAWYTSLGVTFLQNRSIVIDGYKIIGTTLWSDIDPLRSFMITQQVSDFYLISWKNKRFFADDAKTLFDEQLNYLIDELETDMPCIVMTHHAPSYQSIAPQYALSDINSAFASNLDNVIKAYRPVLWVHGHMHNSSDYYIDNTRIVCNPRGYVHREAQQFTWDSDHCIEV